MSESAQHGLHPLWAEFTDPDTEARFQATVWPVDRRAFLLAGGLATLSTVLKGVVHGAVYPDALALGWAVHGSVIALCVGLVALVLGGAGRRTLTMYGSATFVLFATGFVLLDVAIGALAVQFAAVAALLAAGLAWLPGTLRQLAGVSVTILVIHLLALRQVAFAEGELPITLQIIALILILLTPARYRTEVVRRQRFAQQEVIARQTEEYHALLLQVLPAPIADRLSAGERDIADLFDDATVLFADIVGFSRWSRGKSPGQVLGLLRDLFGAFDDLAGTHGLEKIKTIGDAYMVAGGVPDSSPGHAERVAEFALDMVETAGRYEALDGSPLELRVGIHTGPLVGGVTGELRFIYDLWGDTVNTASRMESHGTPGRIQVSQAVYEAIGEHFLLEERGVVEVKGRGPMRTWWLIDKNGPMAG